MREQLMIQKAAHDFAKNECLPGVIERDEKQKFPKEQVLKLADLGFLGMMVDAKYGGSRNGHGELCPGHGRDQQNRRKCERCDEREQ